MLSSVWGYSLTQLSRSNSSGSEYGTKKVSQWMRSKSLAIFNLPGHAVWILCDVVLVKDASNSVSNIHYYVFVKSDLCSPLHGFSHCLHKQMKLPKSMQSPCCLKLPPQYCMQSDSTIWHSENKLCFTSIYLCMESIHRLSITLLYSRTTTKRGNWKVF